MSEVNFNVQANRALPSPIAPGLRGPARGDRYGNIGVVPFNKWRHAVADQGRYFVAHNTTNDASTTLAGHAAPVLADADATMTKPFIHCRSNLATSSLERHYLDYIEIEVITAGANGTADSWAAQLDTGATRVTTAGTALTTINPNMQSTNTSALAVQGGVVVTGAESANVRDLGFGQFRPSIALAGDKYLFLFGSEPIGHAGFTATINRHVVNLGPVILGPTDQLLLALYSPSQSAAGVYKVRMGWTEL